MMSWVDACFKRRLLIYIAAIALCLLGIFCLFTVPVAPFPLPSFPVFSIQASYPGASAQAVQTQVTDKIVHALKGTNDVQSIQANSQADKANIQVTLDNKDSATLLRTQISIMQAIASSHLPSSVPQPVVTQASGRSSLITFTVASKQLSLFQLDNFIQSTLYPKFSSLPGVSVFNSNQNPVVKIKLDPEKMAKYRLDPVTISNRINSSFHANPLGNLYIQQQTYTLGISNSIHSLPQFNNLIIGSDQAGQPIRLKVIWVHFGRQLLMG